VPLLRDEEIIGTVQIARARVEPFTAKQIDLVTAFAAQATIAIENSRRERQLRDLFERAMIRERVSAGLERAKAQGKKLGRRRNEDPKLAAEVRRLRAKGLGIGKVARTLRVGASYVQRIEAEHA
jgi:DNA invertase Pin-like site-specific DNA recombinase